MLAAVDQQHAISGHAAPREREQPIFHIGWEGGGAHIEAELDGRRDLVDVLTARPGGAYEALFDLALVYGNGVGNPHGDGTKV